MPPPGVENRWQFVGIRLLVRLKKWGNLSSASSTNPSSRDSGYASNRGRDCYNQLGLGLKHGLILGPSPETRFGNKLNRAASRRDSVSFAISSWRHRACIGIYQAITSCLVGGGTGIIRDDITLAVRYGRAVPPATSPKSTHLDNALKKRRGSIRSVFGMAPIMLLSITGRPKCKTKPILLTGGPHRSFAKTPIVQTPFVQETLCYCL